jgi:hypothetical protein
VQVPVDPSKAEAKPRIKHIAALEGALAPALKSLSMCRKCKPFY